MIVFLSCDFGVKENKLVKVIKSDKLKNYIDRFNKNDDEIYKQFIPNDEALLFLSKNIPMIDLPDKEIE